jgi:hypothetical protein
MNSERDRSYLEDLINCARDQILPLATSGSEVQAIGEFWEAVELWAEGSQDDAQVNVSIGVYCEEGDPDDFLEHLHVDARVNDSSIELSTLRRTYTKEAGSDHHSEILAVLTQNKSLDDSGVAKWHELLEEVLGYESCRVSVSRDHL